MVASAVPCYFRRAQSQSIPEGPIRAEYDDRITQDTLYCGYDTNIQDGDIVKNTDVGDERFGRFYAVRGEAQETPAAGNRYVNNKVLLVSRLETNSVPVGVS